MNRTGIKIIVAIGKLIDQGIGPPYSSEQIKKAINSNKDIYPALYTLDKRDHIIKTSFIGDKAIIWLREGFDKALDDYSAIKKFLAVGDLDIADVEEEESRLNYNIGEITVDLERKDLSDRTIDHYSDLLSEFEPKLDIIKKIIAEESEE